MKRLVAPALLCAVGLCWVHAAEAAPRRIDTGKRAAQFTPRAEENTVTPEVQPTQRAEVVQEKRFDAGELRPRQEALIGERRAPIEVSERREKETFIAPAPPDYERRPQSADNPWSRQNALISTADGYARTRTAERFQAKIDEARPVVKESRATISKPTTFDRINRFVFRKNSDQRPTVQRAGGEQAPIDIGGDASAAQSALPQGVETRTTVTAEADTP
jgi:hypothetical protein